MSNNIKSCHDITSYITFYHTMKYHSSIHTTSHLMSFNVILHCTSLHYTSLHCTPLHCNVLHFTILRQVASLMGIKNLSSRSLKVSASESRAAAECSSIAEDFLLVSGCDKLFYSYVDMLCSVVLSCTVLCQCYGM